MAIRIFRINFQMVLMFFILLWAGLASADEPRFEEDQYIIQRVERLKRNFDASQKKGADLNAIKVEIERCALQLTRPMCWKKLGKYSNELVRYLTDYKTNRKSAIVLGRCDISKELRDDILKSPRTPLMVKARLGDAEATKEIIRLFREESSMYGKSIQAEALLYIENEETMNEFFKAMESVEYLEDFPEKTYKMSFFYITIKAYADVNPQVELFRYRTINKFVGKVVEPEKMNLKNITYMMDDNEKKEYQAFLRKVENYFLETYGVELHLNPPFTEIGLEIKESYLIYH